MLAFWTFGTCCFGNCINFCSNGEAYIVFFVLQGCMRISAVVLSSILISYLRSIKSISDANIEKLTNAQFVDCSDDLSVVRVEPAIESQETVVHLVNKGIIFLAVCLSIIVCEVCCIIGVPLRAKLNERNQSSYYQTNDVEENLLRDIDAPPADYKIHAGPKPDTIN